MSANPVNSPPVAALKGASSGVTGPAANVGVPVIFFDGVCGLCNAWIDFVVERDKTRVFRFGPVQGETAREWLNLPPEAALDSVMLVDSSGIYRKSDAVWRILARLPGPSRLAAGLLVGGNSKSSLLVLVINPLSWNSKSIL